MLILWNIIIKHQVRRNCSVIVSKKRKEKISISISNVILTRYRNVIIVIIFYIKIFCTYNIYNSLIVLDIVDHVIKIVSAFKINNFAQDHHIITTPFYECVIHYSQEPSTTRLNIHPLSLVIKTKLRFSYNYLTGDEISLLNKA